ncbi:MAG: exopolysaccharide biosynthesis protein [Verrucomicrobiota bacterium]
MERSQNSLSNNLFSVLDGVAERISVGMVADRVADKGFGILLILLSLPSALPVPAPGYSTPFGILLVVLGIQMVIGRVQPWLPEKARKKEFSKERAEKVFRSAGKILHKMEVLVRPRMRWINSRGGRVFFGAVVIGMASLMILPIPLTNTLPAFVIFVVGISLSEDDGLMAIGAFVLGILAAAFYAYIIYLLATVGMDGVVQFKEWIKDQL